MMCALAGLQQRERADSATATTGELIVYDALSLTVRNVFTAHKGPIAALALSPSASMLATASVKVPQPPAVHSCKVSHA